MVLHKGAGASPPTTSDGMMVVFVVAAARDRQDYCIGVMNVGTHAFTLSIQLSSRTVSLFDRH